MSTNASTTSTTSTTSELAAVTTAQVLIRSFDRDESNHKVRTETLLTEYADTAINVPEAKRKVMKRTAWSVIVEEYTERATVKGWDKVRLPISQGTFSDSCGRAIAIVKLASDYDDQGRIVPGSALEYCAQLVADGFCSWELGQLTTAVRTIFEVSADDMKGPDADADADADAEPVGERETASLLDVTLANLPNLDDSELSAVIGLAQQLLETRNADADADAPGQLTLATSAIYTEA